MRFLHSLILSLLLILFLPISHAAAADICRQFNGHKICILSIQRSAKNYWEYRAAVSVDGKERPIEIYNCRDRIKLAADSRVISFQQDEAGELICRFFKK